MIGKIIGIDENVLEVELIVNPTEVQNIINLYVLISDKDKNYVGEIINLKNKIAFINLIGEFINNNFVYGLESKPSFASTIHLIATEYVNKIIGMEKDSFYIGNSTVYKNVKVGAEVNAFFGHHFAIMGSTGSGKSCGFAKIMQNLFEQNAPIKANILIFDSYGEYRAAFQNIGINNPNVKFKFLTTSFKANEETLSIPIWLLDVDDFALLLNVKKNSQINILEKTLKFLNVFVKGDVNSNHHKSQVIAKALLEILVSGRNSAQIRDQFFSVLTKYNTSELNLDSIIEQPGYNRPLKQCLLIDESGKIRAIELVTQFLTSFLTEEVDLSVPNKTYKYTLDDLAYALDFALIDEGILRNEEFYNDIYYLKANLNTLKNSSQRKYFDYPTYVNHEDFIKRLLYSEGKKSQIINFNINYIDDRLAKVITKIYSKLIFNFVKNLENRATIPFHIVLEEAHRYVQNDSDKDIIGYNIFDRIAKEGRKYGILLGLISQRPAELSETTLSQCNNFLIFKMLHPTDIDFVAQIVPSITLQTLKKMQVLQAGNCMVFGTAFKMPTLIKIDMPNPAPASSNCNILKNWY